MAKVISSERLARRLVMKKTQHGTSRRYRPRNAPKIIASIATEAKYRGNVKRFIDWLQERKLFVDDVTPELAKQFLEEKCGLITQKTMDGYRQAISLVLEVDVDYVRTKGAVLVPRAYGADQIALLYASAEPDVELAIRACCEGGLRPHELHTIARVNELVENTRAWLPERFIGRECDCKYVVIGKGGLRRVVLLSASTAEALEELRLPTSIIVREREINYLKRYQITGGQAFSQRFSTLAKKVLGWSSGAYGLRHRFAKDRLAFLQKHGFHFDYAVRILSQEMGHFSIKNTLTYLR